MSSSIKMTLLGHLSALSIPSDTSLNFICQKSLLLSSTLTRAQLFPSPKQVTLFHHFHSILGRQLNKWWMRNRTSAKFRSNSRSVSIHFRHSGDCFFPWFLCGVCCWAFGWVVLFSFFGGFCGVFFFLLLFCLGFFCLLVLKAGLSCLFNPKQITKFILSFQGVLLVNVLTFFNNFLQPSVSN